MNKNLFAPGAPMSTNVIEGESERDRRLRLRREERMKRNTSMNPTNILQEAISQPPPTQQIPTQPIQYQPPPQPVQVQQSINHSIQPQQYIKFILFNNNKIEFKRI